MHDYGKKPCQWKREKKRIKKKEEAEKKDNKDKKPEIMRLENIKIMAGQQNSKK